VWTDLYCFYHLEICAGPGKPDLFYTIKVRTHLENLNNKHFLCAYVPRVLNAYPDSIKPFCTPRVYVGPNESNPFSKYTQMVRRVFDKNT
jgi:hypothetical protein